jgi:hypothetical protein
LEERRKVSFKSAPQAIAASGEAGLEKTFVVKFGARFLGTVAADFQNQ